MRSVRTNDESSPSAGAGIHVFILFAAFFQNKVGFVNLGAFEGAIAVTVRRSCRRGKPCGAVFYRKLFNPGFDPRERRLGGLRASSESLRSTRRAAEFASGAIAEFDRSNSPSARKRPQEFELKHLPSTIRRLKLVLIWLKS